MGLVGCFGADSQVELGPNMSIAWGLLLSQWPYAGVAQLARRPHL